MNRGYRIHIDIPSGISPLIEYRRDLAVQGRLEGDIESDMILHVELLDENGTVLRRTCASRKNDDRLWLNHPDLVSYEEELDPKKEKLKAFGFPELLVKDLCDPLASVHDATIKCSYSDSAFKSLIVSGTDVRHGRVLESGLDLRDEDGEPYETLPEGLYTLRVRLCDREDLPLAEEKKQIRIGIRKEAAIVRFNPKQHRKRMEEWCGKNGFTIINDPLPGYLDPYLGKWYYHMGLLPYYRSNDIAVYAQARVNMFVYLCDPHSTSYETELAYLQSKRRVDDGEWFRAYHYDIGEYAVGDRKGNIVPFADDDVLCLCRVDVVNEKTKENVYDLSERNRIRSFFDEEEMIVNAGERIAVSLIVRPRQLDPADVVLTKENIYVYKDQISILSYEIDDGQKCFHEERKLLMDRIDEGASIGLSVYEAYNVFPIPETSKGKILEFRIRALDQRGKGFGKPISFKVKAI
ncbi:MAG: hypothetical protein K5908_02000 [Erysipelotrichaceae bacterium]|nr:hypothetical protein [Erysipelotrichaceae bacterium]